MKSEILEPAEASPFPLHSYFTFHPLPTIQSSRNSRLLHRDLHPGRYVGAEEVEDEDIVQLTAQIAALNLPVDPDLTIRAAIKNPDFEKHIRDHGREWYRRNLEGLGCAG